MPERNIRDLIAHLDKDGTLQMIRGHGIIGPMSDNTKSLNNPSGNKSIVLINSHQEGKSFSAEELMARELNSWQGWLCAASVENLCVTHDGNIFGAVCREGGFLGNVFESFVDLSTEFILCKKRWCMCGTDMALRKFRSPEHRQLAYLDPVKELADAPLEALAVQPIYQSQCIPKQVTWEISRRCNYSCSYCPPSSSNNYEAHRSWGSLKQGLQNIFRAFVKNDQCKFHFSGGEPTINPSFVDLLKWIKDRPPENKPGSQHYCHVTTNGSRQPEYYEELISYTQIGISVHFEFADQEKLLETIQAIVEKKKASADLRWQWFGVRLMVPPGYGPQAETLTRKIYEIPDFRNYGQLNISPIIRFAPNYEGHLADYEESEKALFEIHG
ncbi:MAG: radical SAM protein [Bdellovibrionales bacterium]|nr:radical SAM protein [Bdellovibrionales bacterium]